MALDTTLKYLIRHSETLEYLYPSSDGSSVKTKALNDSEKGSTAYQWTLDLKFGGYWIKNASNMILGNENTPIANGNIPAALKDPSAGSFKWTISKEEVGKAVQLTLKNEKGILFYLYRISGAVVVVSDKKNTFKGHESWILVLAAPPKAAIPSLIPKKDPLPKGSYRIRAFNSSYLLTMPATNTQKPRNQNRNAYLGKQQSNIDAEKYQRWEVEPCNDSGLYSIRNSGTESYLGYTDKGLQGDLLVGLSARFPKWTIQTADGVMFFIGLGDSQSPLSIGIPNYEGKNLNEVKLEPSDSIPSQIWFFEVSK